MVNIERLSSNGQTFQLASADSGPNTFLDEVGFQFCDATDERDKQPNHRAVRRDVFAAADELNAKGIQFIHDAKEVFGASGEAVERGDDENSELPLPRFAQHRVEAGTPSLGTTDANVRVLCNDLEASLSSELAKVVKLVIHSLL